MKSDKIIITIGSSRFSKDFVNILPKNSGYSVEHIKEEKKLGYSKSTQELIKEINSIINDKKTIPSGFIAFGRNTVMNSVENISEAIDHFRSIPEFKNVKFVSPTNKTVKIFTNKWETYKKLSKDGFSLLRTELLTDDTLDRVFAMLQLNNFPLPAVIKATYLTGGTGMRLVTSANELKNEYAKQKEQGIKESILVEYVQGPECMTQMMYLDGRMVVFPMTIAEPTQPSLEHGDNKVKICGYINHIPYIYDQATRIAKKYNTCGYFAIEGIVYDIASGMWKIMEGMTRFTGSYPMPNATYPSFHCLTAIYNYIDGRNWDNYNKTKQEIVLQIPIFKSELRKAEELVNNLNASFKWIIQSRVDDLTGLPLSVDTRVRIQMTIATGERNDLKERCLYLEQILEDKTIYKRIIHAFNTIDLNFAKLVRRPGLYV